ncbi:hypothetical protein SAY87_016233 [Trapa incisa]|uniref:Structure-specific endonuclease subunit SLX1 homolog n=1 Tax=Trapa incisa TaxID=236973 RepID=A0AAN7LGZ7_9MYRT|nr:hypothetical protein SAY87_016233 [Trapa incisa]
MRRRRGEAVEEEEEEEEGAVEETEGSSKRFYGCYLLASLSPRHKGKTYIGFTVNPKRRIRQHNGEMRSGAWRTKSKRPWEMVLYIYGFPTNVSALQFEWAWQHPRKSIAVREAAANFKSLSGIAHKIKLAYAMLTLPSWHSMNITVNYFSTKYLNHSAGCMSLPKQMKVRICPMDELPCYVDGSTSPIESDNEWEEYGESDSASGTQDDSLANAAVHTLPANEILESCKSYDGQQFAEASVFGAKDGLQSILLDSPLRALSPIKRKLSSLDDANLIDRTIEEFGAQLDQHADGQSLGGSTSINTVTSPTSPDIEIIELVTPPPDPRGEELRAKRRRVPTVSKQVIDLTNSPVFIQL